MPFANPNTLHPVPLPDGSVHKGTVFLKPAIDHPRIEVGDYSYASTFDPPDDWAARIAPYLYEFSPEKLAIGKFCQFADSVMFITSSANHRHDGFTSFPFMIFDDAPAQGKPSMPTPGPDTLIGNDVWIGQGSRILPGTTIGNGVIVGAGSVVSGHIPDYAVVAGNRAKIVRMRFDDETISNLNELAWWDWDIDHILANEAAIVGSDMDRLKDARP